MDLKVCEEGRLSVCARATVLGVVFMLIGCNSQKSDSSGRFVRNRPPARNQLMTLSTDGTHLINGFTNKPVFITGDSPQLLMLQIPYADAELYLADRASRGFNALWVYPVDAVDQSNAPKNFYGEVPFEGPDFTNENPKYWTYVDRLLKLASTYGITLVMDPGFVGLSNEPGYLKSYLNSSDAVLNAYGAWLGNRYKNYGNIIWSLGGDADPSVPGLYAKIEQLATGLASADPNHLITLEACRWCTPPNQSTLNAFRGNPPSWLDLNWVYNTQPTVITGCQDAYSASPANLPSFMGEDWYELDHSLTALQVRAEGYWEVLSGCPLGRLFGNVSIWTFNSPHHPSSLPWKSQLSSEGSVSQAFLGRLMSSREHWKLVPDVDHTVVIAGYGSGLTSTTTARTSDGQTIISYIPTGNATTITVDMSKITNQAHQAKCWWFNPASGDSAQIGVFPATGSRNFSAPDSKDWVLVIDDLSANLDAPGSVQSTRSKTQTLQKIGAWEASTPSGQVDRRPH